MDLTELKRELSIAKLKNSNLSKAYEYWKEIDGVNARTILTLIGIQSDKIFILNKKIESLTKYK